jgi:ABC-2 type transport system ATP-binding protein
MIHLYNVRKQFGSFTAVESLSIDVKPGELYGFLGPNGAGKTTTIKMMTGLFTPTSGTITINGFDIQKEPLKAKRQIGYIPDQPFLYEKLTGREYLHFSAGLHRMEFDAVSGRIKEIIDMLEIGPWMDRRIEDYSQGMRQRNVIAAALLHSPKVLIIDEPMVGLDPRSAHVVKELFRLQANNGTAIFMSTHSLNVAEELCDRIGIIKDGKLIFENSSSEFLAFKHKHNGKFESVFLELTK